MNNITYTIIDNSSKEVCENDKSINKESELIDMEVQIKKCKYSNEDIEQKINENLAKAIDYELNYNNKYLITILDFYEIKRQKFNKKELIQKIIEFETDINNQEIVNRRHRLFANFIELKNDKFFSKYIMGGL